MVQKITFLFVLSLFAISSMAGVVFSTTQMVSFQRQRYQVSVEFPLEGEAEAVRSIRNWINDVVGVEDEQASDERTFLQVLERSYQDYLKTNPEGSRHIEIYRAYEDEDCVTFQSVITDQDSVVWKTCDCATFGKKDGHRLKVNEIFNCSEERIKQGSVENQWGNNLLFILIIPTFALWKKKCYAPWQLLFCLLKY